MVKWEITQISSWTYQGYGHGDGQERGEMTRDTKGVGAWPIGMVSGQDQCRGGGSVSTSKIDAQFGLSRWRVPVVSISHQEGGSVWMISVDHQDGGSGWLVSVDHQDKQSEEMGSTDGQGGLSDGQSVRGQPAPAPTVTRQPWTPSVVLSARVSGTKKSLTRGPGGPICPGGPRRPGSP